MSLLCLVSSVQQTYPAQEGVAFGAVVGLRQFCQILLARTGTITPSPDYLELSSKQAGGITGQARITATNSSFSIVSVDAPGTFNAMPTSGDTGVSFTASYLTSGATNTGETDGTTGTRLRRGDTLVDVHLVATRVGSVFPAGNYNAEVTIRCE
ncbi:MAG: hypothetical protein ACR2O3_01690 [Rhizobiaceae bacterium]